MSRRHLLIPILLISLFSHVLSNRPPQFVLPPGQSEIVLRLKEGKETPVGTLVAELKGFDFEEDTLTFGLKSPSNVLRIENNGRDEANIYLNKELDRETQDSYNLILTLTDGHLGQGSFVTQSLLLLVEDVNDNGPICRTDNSTVKVAENGKVPLVLATIECYDLDEGAFGQVIYKLETDPGDEDLFSLDQTKEGTGILRLLQPLDYDRKFLYQLKVIASDRANSQQVNSAINPIVIQVLDKEDSPPQWIQVPSLTRIPEDTPVGSYVLQVRAVDGDHGVNNPIRYSLLNERNLFGIDAESGVLYTIAKLDREDESRNGNYILQITAMELSNSEGKNFSVSTEVSVLLLDVNDETPHFASRSYVAEIVENQPVDVPLTFLGDSVPECFDLDLGVNGTFRLYTSGDGGIFEVTPNQGINQVSFLVRVKDPLKLDYERIKVINFTLVAEEKGIEKKKSQVGITVFLRDANDNSPQFEKEIYQVSMNENPAPGTPIVQVRATDADSGLLGTDGIRYTSLTGSIAHQLVLNPISGLLSLGSSPNNSFDRELHSLFFLTVEARDSGGRGNRNTVQVQISLNDLNDEKPIFLLSHYEGRVFENQLNFTSPLIIKGKDKDLPYTRNSEIYYSLVPGPWDSYFKINLTTGEMGLKKPLDFESISLGSKENVAVRRINLTVRARDLGIPSLHSAVPLTILVLDTNDHRPRFKSRFYNQIVEEDAADGTALVKVEALDEDGSDPFNRVYYRMESGPGDKFRLDSESGLLSLSHGASLDYNLNKFHILKIVAVDGGGLVSQFPTVVNITIQDVNNKSPRFVGIGSDGNYDGSVRENSPQGTYIMEVKAIDPDSQHKLLYGMNLNESEGRSPEGRMIRGRRMNGLFSLNPTDGTLRTGPIILDRERISAVKLKIFVEDQRAKIEKQIDTAFVHISVQDEQDNPPVFSKTVYTASLMENSKAGTVVLTVAANDVDLNTNIRYGLMPLRSESNPLNFPLRIHPETGTVIVAIPEIDRETRDWINFTVYAEDGGNGPKSSGIGRASVVVRILDQNDNSPVFNEGELNEIEVSEDVSVGSVIGQVTATDKDEGANGRVSYTIHKNSGSGKFRIEPESGRIRVSSTLDREESSSYSIVVEAFDNWFGTPSANSRSAFKNIRVTITDVNDSPPVFDRNEESFGVTEFHDGVIGIVRATDADAPETINSEIVFAIKRGNELGLFKLEQGNSSAKILPARSLKGFYGNYTLEIEAADQGKEQNFARKDFHIQVIDFNDNAPRFITQQNLTVSIPENATIGSSVLQIRAIDSDTELNGMVRYRFKRDSSAHSDSFSIDSTTGLITLQRPLDRKKTKVFHLRIEAFDLGTVSLSSELDVHVKVERVASFVPHFTIPSITLEFQEEAEIGAERIKLPETVGSEDDIEEESPVICYFILPDSLNSSGIFYVEPYEHWVSPKIILDREQKENYTFVVGANTDCEGKKLLNLELTSTLQVTVTLIDINDNSPKFEKRVFSGGISTGTPFGSVVIDLIAVDKDEPNSPNSELEFFIIPPIEIKSEGLSHLISNSTELFLVEENDILLNFDPQPDMKGFFRIELGVRDAGGLSDSAVGLIYLLRDDQKVKVVVRQNPAQVRSSLNKFLLKLSNVTGLRVNCDMSSFRFHENAEGTIDRTKTDFFIHFVHPERNDVLEVEEALHLIDLKIEELDSLFQEFHVLDTQGVSLSPRRVEKGLSAEGRSLFLVYASGTAAFLGLLLLVVISLACAQRSKYQRRLKAATANAYGSSSTILPRNGNLPNTNVHSGEGSNPIWMQAYHNNWYKEETQSISGNSDGRDSLEDAGMESASPPSSHMRSFLGSSADKHYTDRRHYKKNILYEHPTLETNSTCLILKKHLETTEL